MKLKQTQAILHLLVVNISLQLETGAPDGPLGSPRGGRQIKVCRGGRNERDTPTGKVDVEGSRLAEHGDHAGGAGDVPRGDVGGEGIRRGKHIGKVGTLGGGPQGKVAVKDSAKAEHGAEVMDLRKGESGRREK